MGATGRYREGLFAPMGRSYESGHPQQTADGGDALGAVVTGEDGDDRHL